MSDPVKRVTVAGAVAGLGLLMAGGAIADNHTRDATAEASSASAPANVRTGPAGTLSVEGTGLQEIEAALRAAQGTESVEGTGLMHTPLEPAVVAAMSPVAGTALDGTESVEGTGLMRAAGGTQSVEGTGLQAVENPEGLAVVPAGSAPSAVTEAGRAADDPVGD